ncbi:MAG: septum formation initiator family protein [Candidatus Aminicenantes bacterium]|nr:septum formation initiator family protein [Candidatus Aminicenantes bacterium]
MNRPIKIGRWIVIGIVFILLIFLLTGRAGLINMYRFHQGTQKISEEITRRNETIDSLKTTIKKLEKDTAYIEKIAREKLGMAKKGEKVYKFVEE